jgi:hypothetical protein
MLLSAERQIKRGSSHFLCRFISPTQPAKRISQNQKNRCIPEISYDSHQIEVSQFELNLSTEFRFTDGRYVEGFRTETL